MKRLVSLIALMVLPFFALLGRVPCAQATEALPPTVDTVWSVVQSPYEVSGEFIIPASVTLTIEAGVEVRFDAGGYFHVQGRLVAQGSTGTPVTLTGLSTDRGSWRGLRFAGTVGTPAIGMLDEVVIEHAGPANQAAIEVMSNVQLQLMHTTVRGAAGDGLLVWADPGESVTLSLIDTQILDNSGDAIHLQDAMAFPSMSNLQTSQNGRDGISIGSSTVTASQVWPLCGSPYWLDGEVSVSAGAQLQLDPGVELRFASWTGLWVAGNLIALGTSALPIVFTSVDEVAGAWRGLWIVGDVGAEATATLGNVRMSYAGEGVLAVIDVRNHAELRLVDAVIDTALTGGLLVSANEASAVTLARVTIQDVQTDAIQIYDVAQLPDLEDVHYQGTGRPGVVLGGGTITTLKRWPVTGSPYWLKSNLDVALGGELYLEPGTELRFNDLSGFRVDGVLQARGTEVAPIIFTAVNQHAGAWAGLRLTGEGSVLSNTVVEYAGYGANASVWLLDATVAFDHTTIRYSSADGLVANNSSNSTFQFGQVVDNAGYGVRVNSGGALLAPYNYWGAATGPRYSCNPAGTGSLVSDDVLFQPFVTEAGAEVGPAAPLPMMSVTLTPLRLMAAANGQSRIWVKLQLRDGAGAPVLGYALRLSASAGEVVDGGVTDLEGATYAYVTSQSPGPVVLTAAAVEPAAGCERLAHTLQSSSLTVHFVEAPIDPLAADAQAPYLGKFEVAPRPVTRGTPTEVRLTLKNPYDHDMLVDADFGYAKSGLGLTFGPIGSTTGVRIPAHGEGVVAVSWTPVVSGHYCFNAQYQWTMLDTATGTARLSGHAMATTKQADAGDDMDANDPMPIEPGPGAGAGGTSGANADVAPAALKSPEKQKRIDKVLKRAEKQMHKLCNAASRSAGEGQSREAQDLARAQCKMALNYWRDLRDLTMDPPSLDYTTFALPTWALVTPVTAGAGVSLELAEAFNNMQSLAVEFGGVARQVRGSFDRYAGAAEANNLLWASLQSSALLSHLTRAGELAQVLSLDLDTFTAQLIADGQATLPISVMALSDWRAQLESEGLDADILAALEADGWSDADVDQLVAQLLATDPVLNAGDIVTEYQALASELLAMGQALETNDNFNNTTHGPTSTKQVGDDSDDEPTQVRVYDQAWTVTVGNPLTTEATLSLQLSPFDMPPGWLIRVVPDSVSLAPGAETDVTVSVVPTTPVVMGAQPSIALEGYVDDLLIGGVLLTMVAPHDISLGTSCTATANKGRGDLCSCALECGTGLVCAPPAAGEASQCLAPCAGATGCEASATCQPWHTLSGVCVSPVIPESSAAGGCDCRSVASPAAWAVLLAAVFRCRHRRRG